MTHTPDTAVLDYLLVRAIILGTVSSLSKQKTAQAWGILPRAYDTSENAGRPWRPNDGSEWLNTDRAQIASIGDEK